MPNGLSFYVRALKSQGTPKQFAKRLADHRMGWVAFGGPWHERGTTRWINPPDKIRAFSEAAAEQAVQPFVWGYPSADRPTQFVEQILSCKPSNVVLDPEREMNRARKMAAKPAGARAGEVIVRGLREELGEDAEIGCSTYGNPPKWFPLEGFRECDFMGGQLYTVTPVQIRKMLDAWEARVQGLNATIEHVPNPGNYEWVVRNGKRVAVPVTVEVLESRLGAFVSSPVPFDALILWAENFATPAQWKILAKWAEWLKRGVCALDPVM